MSSIEAQARELHGQIQQAPDSAAKQAARTAFHQFYERLTSKQKAEVQPFLNELLSRAGQLADELQDLTHRAEERLKNSVKFSS